MRQFKFLIFITFFFLQPGFISYSQNLIQLDNSKIKDTSINNNQIEESIIDTIFSLAEVKDKAKYIEQQTNGKRDLKIWVVAAPNLAHKYYWIKVGEDNGTNLVTHFNFYVYPDSMRIIYLDTKNNKELTIDEWRKVNGR